MRTPALMIDYQQMLANIKQMEKKVVLENHLTLRPHIKTHKIPELAHLQLAAGATGITVAKLSEAQVMIAAGITDIFLAYPLVTDDNLQRAFELLPSTTRFIFSIDSLYGAERLAHFAQQKQLEVEVRIEIDTGLNRTGVSPGELLAFAKSVTALNGLLVTGIYTYRGPKMSDTQPTKDILAAGLEESQLMVALGEKLREAGISIVDISVGSTPTLEGVIQVPGITEVRPGTYIFNDAMQVAYGVCPPSKCAATVLVTVVSKHEDQWVVVDGGSKAFATDVQPTKHPVTLNGFGLVKNHPKMVFERMNEEHGVLLLNGDNVEIGQQLEIIPNHICSTVNLYNYVYLDQRKTIVAARGQTQ